MADNPNRPKRVTVATVTLHFDEGERPTEDELLEKLRNICSRVKRADFLHEDEDE